MSTTDSETSIYHICTINLQNSLCGLATIHTSRHMGCRCAMPTSTTRRWETTNRTPQSEPNPLSCRRQPQPCKASKQLGNVRRGEQAYSSLLVLNPAYPSHAVQLPRADHIPAPLACHPTPQGALPRPGAMPPEPNPHRERTGPWYVPAPKHSGASHSPPSSGPCGATRPTNSPRRKTHDDEAPHQTNPTRANARK